VKTIINPIVDCVFKAILGSENHKRLLIHFLNAILELEGDQRVVDVVSSDPFNKKEMLVEKYSVVDVKATDQLGRIFQLEVQLVVKADLPERILYNWSSIYGKSLESGDNYAELKPVISIWLLADNLFRDVDNVHISFGVFSAQIQCYLTDHCRIHLLQLKNWPEDAKIVTERDRWICFFRFGGELDPDNLPEWMETEEMREAMEIKQSFAEKGENWLLYLSRMDKLREERTSQIRLEQALAAQQKASDERDQERRAKEQALAAKEQAIREKDRYRRLLENAGIDPKG